MIRRNTTLFNVFLIVSMLLGLAASPMQGGWQRPVQAASGPLAFDSDTGFHMVADFESGMPTKFVAYSDKDNNPSSPTVVIPAVETADLPMIPAPVGNHAMHVSYAINTGGYAGVTQDLETAEDWSDYQYFTLLMKGENSGLNVTLELKSDGTNQGGVSNRWVYTFADNFSDWRLVRVPFTSFVKRTDYNPGSGLGDTLVLTKMWGYSVMLPLTGGATHNLSIDRVAVTADVNLADFQVGAPDGFQSFVDADSGSGSTNTAALTIGPGDVPQLPLTLNGLATLNYDTTGPCPNWGNAVVGSAGVTYDSTTIMDWSSYSAFSFWYYGGNTGAAMRVELKSDGTNASGVSNRFVYGFADDFTGWKFFNIPFSSFVKRTDWNPGSGLGDTLKLDKMWGYSILVPAAVKGSFKLDQVALYGKLPALAPKIEFSTPSVTVVEGETATLTVALSMDWPDAVTVDYATADGTTKAGQDYTAASGTLTFAPHETQQTITVDTLQDTTFELNETFSVTLSNPSANARLGAKTSAAVTITDDDKASPVVNDPFITILDDYEESSLPYFRDSYNNEVGYVTWGDAPNTTLSQVETKDAADPLALPGFVTPNKLLKVDFNINGYGGFTRTFLSQDGTTWVSQDWSTYSGVSFWLYGNNTGGDVNLDIFDNRTTTGDSCQRWTYIFKDDFTGWKFFSIPFEYFTLKSWQPNGAPTDAFNRYQVWAYAFGFPGGKGAQTMYLDKFGLVTRHTAIDNYESGLPLSNDTYGNGIGFVTWGSVKDNTTLSTVETTDGADPLALPGYALPNNLLKVDYDIADKGWGGFTHAFESGSTWVSQNWVTYLGVSFWFYGANSGGDVNIDVMDNRAASSNGDTAERFTYIFKDNFTGWKFFKVPFTDFTRKGYNPPPTPDDGFGKTEIWGYAFGFPAGAGAQTNYIDNVEIYGDTQLPPAIPLHVSFADISPVTEGQAATITVKLNVPTGQPVTVKYATSDGSDAASPATAGKDYTATSGTLTFAPNETQKTFTVQTLQDAHSEPRESVTLTLSSPTVADLGAPWQADLNINDDDPANPRMVDDFESVASAYKYTVSGPVSRSLVDIPAGDAKAVPGQEPVNSVLKVNVTAPNSASAQAQSAASITRDFAQSVDWSSAGGMKFWYYGTNSGKNVTVTVKENRAAPAAPSKWVPVWGDDFNTPAGTQPNSDKWGYDLGGQGWGNNELEYYTKNAENASTDGSGNLLITARQIADTDTRGLLCHYGPCQYTSARLLSSNRFNFAYGRAEARIKVPAGQGMWPAFWMLGQDIYQNGWPNAGEVDIMENIGKEPNIVHGTVHGPGYSGGQGKGGPVTLASGNFADDFHVFAIEWEPTQIRWYMDDMTTPYFTLDKSTVTNEGKQWVFDHPFFLILNLAVGGGWPGNPDNTTVFPQSMAVDYVHVYQSPDTAERFEYTFADNFTGWKQVSVPFFALKRAVTQPANAPQDGFTGKEVWGYSFTFAGDTPAAYYLDDVSLMSATQRLFLPLVNRKP